MLELRFKHAIYHLNYGCGEMNISKMIPGVSLIFKSNRSLSDIKEFDLIEKINDKYYIIRYNTDDKKERLGKVCATIKHNTNPIPVPFTGFPGKYNVFRCIKHVKSIRYYECIIYTEKYVKWIPLNPIKYMKYRKEI